MLDRENQNFNKMFDELPLPPIIANQLDVTSEEGKKHLNQLLLTKYEGDSLSNVPSCHCGSVTGLDNLHKTCDACGDICETMLNRPIYPMVWMAVPDGVPAFLNPTVYHPMKKAMTVDGCSDLEWLLDPLYQPTRLSVRCRRLEQRGVQRGIKYFYDNFADIMAMYFEAWRVRKHNQDKEDFERFINMLIQDPEQLFCQHLPMPSRVGFVMENNDTGSYLDIKNVSPAINALMTIVSIKNAVRPMDLRNKEHRVVKCINILSPFYLNAVSKTLGGKPGMFRKNLIGGKVNFTGRAVITSIHGIHRYDELHYPWSMSVSLFRPMIQNKLLSRGFTPKEINRVLRHAAKNYDPLIDEIFDELLAEASSEGGIRVHMDDLELDGIAIDQDDEYLRGIGTVFQRNPSLKRLSMQYLYVTKILKNPRINSIALSVLVIKGMNADFDGDALNLLLPVDRDMRSRLERLAPHFGVMDLDKPWQISSDVRYPGAVARLVSNWLIDQKRLSDEYNMKSS